jgi:hypothetical protein
MEEFIMTKKSLITEEKNVQWKNWHKTKNVGGKVSRIFKPYNKYDDHTAPEKAFVPGLAGLQEIIKRAGAANKSVRAYGSRQSLNNIAFNNEYMVDSTELNYCLVGLTDSRHVSPGFEEKRDRLAFVQCGVMVRDLNRKLQILNLALPTSGASDGQRFVAAVSTGTHGSARSAGSMQDYVRGIHLVTSAEECVFIQRESVPVVTGDFCTWLGRTRLIQDDELFDAALVGLGSFGFVHGLLIETEPKYILKRFIKHYRFDEVKEAICTLDVSGLGLPQGDKLPFHFEVLLNPYRRQKRYKGAIVRGMYRDIFQTQEGTFEYHNYPKRTNDLIESMGRCYDKPVYSPIDIPLVVQSALRHSFPPTDPGVLEFGFPGDQFQSRSSGDDTSPILFRTTSIEIAVPLEKVKDAMKIIFDVTKRRKFVAPLAFRYVKSSSAMLAFTRYSPVTAVMEMPGLDNSLSRKGHKAIFAALAGSGIPHSYHWGKGLPLNPDWVSKSYGDETIKAWKRRRLELLGEQGCRMFSNKLLETIGLHNT